VFLLSLICLLGLGFAAYVLWARARFARNRGLTGGRLYSGLSLSVAKLGIWDIRYHKSGRGPAILLVHGLGANLFCWRPLAALLSKHFTVVMPDLPGFGRSSKVTGASYGLDEQAERLKELMAKLGFDSFYIVGNSMGGNIALWMAYRYPTLVKGCAVISPAASRGLAPFSVRPLTWLSGPLSYAVNKRYLRWAHRHTVSRPDLIDDERVQESFQTYGGNREAVRSFLAAVDCIRDPRLGQNLKNIKTRVIVLWGSEDKVTPIRVLKTLEASLAAEETHIHEGGGHHLQEDDPDWCAGKIQTFFASDPE